MRNFKDIKAEIMQDPARAHAIKKHIAKFKGEIYTYNKGKDHSHRRWADYWHPRRKR